MQEDNVHLWVSDDEAWIKVVGEGSYQNAPSVRDFGKKVFHHRTVQFAFDLAECTSLDSTFLGVMTGIALRVREFSHGHVRVINVSPENAKRIVDLGLDQLFRLEGPDVS